MVKAFFTRVGPSLCSDVTFVGENTAMADNTCCWEGQFIFHLTNETPGRLIMTHASQLIYIGKSSVVELVEYDVFCSIVIRGTEL